MSLPQVAARNAVRSAGSVFSRVVVKMDASVDGNSLGNVCIATNARNGCEPAHELTECGITARFVTQG